MTSSDRRIKMMIYLVFLVVTSYGFEYSSSVWKKSNESFGSDVKNILIDSKESEKIYVGTSKALFVSNNKGRDFKFVYSPSIGGIEINEIYVPPDEEGLLYLVTDRGLYERSGFNNWSRSFYFSNKAESKCLAVRKVGQKVFLGTEKGLLYKGSDSTGFVKIIENFKDKPINQIEVYGEILIISTNNEIFTLDTESLESERIFFVQGSSGVLDEKNVQVYENTIKAISIKTGLNPVIFVATKNGIFYSYQKGLEWEEMNVDSIPIESATSMLVYDCKTSSHGESNSGQLNCLNIVVSTERGVFLYREGVWSPVYKGMETNKVNCLAMDADGKVYAGTDKGVFTLFISDSLPSKVEIDPKYEYVNVNNEFKNEPKIREVHKLAIEYGEVHLDKIKNWRKSASKRACLPDVSVSFDVDRNRTVSDSIYGSYSSGGQHYVAPDDKTFYRNTGVGISLSWDLADIVWSSYQTSIDSRSKMMVELRGDILDQVTRLYFERRRVQIELLTLVEIEPQFRLEKEMRIAELTALLDSFTGGKFSKRVEEGKKIATR